MKATDLLIRQHRELDQLFDQLDRVDEDDRKIVLEQLARCLVAHSAIEEEMFYPAVKDAARREVEKALVEHSLASYLLAQLLSTPPSHGSFEAKATVLEELVKLHIDREEREILPRAEAALGPERLAQMGERLVVRFEQVSETFRRVLSNSLAQNAPSLGKRGRSTRVKVTAKKRAAPARAKKQAGAQRAAGMQRAAGTKRAGTKRAGTKRAGTKHAAGIKLATGTKRTAAPQRRGARSSMPMATPPQAKRGATSQKSATQARGSKGTRGRASMPR